MSAARLWTIEAYHRAIDEGVFVGIPRVTPAHATATGLTYPILCNTFAITEAHVGIHQPITIPPNSEPEPELAVVRGAIRDYAVRHPAPDEVLLLVEISEGTLAYDRTTKARIYARAGIAEYWILNTRTLEVYRNPQNGAYRSLTIYDESMTVLPLNAPLSAAPIAVADLIP